MTSLEVEEIVAKVFVEAGVVIDAIVDVLDNGTASKRASTQ
jgi:hypothetical protein